MLRRAPRVAFFAAIAGALSCARELAPETQAVVVVDTDLPASIATHLRVDLFSADGAWFETREIVRASARDWPASFGIVSDEARPVFARLRVHPEGFVRDYRGERFGERNGAIPAEGWPLRLVQSGRDRTPASEPEPDVAVDRLVRIDFDRDRKKLVRVVLRGACAGTMTKLAAGAQGIDAAASVSCTEHAGVRAPIVAADAATQDELALSALGSWATAPCEAPPDHGRVCVPGGAFVFGEASRFDELSDFAPRARVVKVGRFFMDAREVTVADYRAALDGGFSPPDPVRVNDAPLAADPVDGCSFTSKAADREALALSCVTWATARAYCAFVGGDLPTEAEWEYAATAAGRDTETSFPWGDEEPTCDRAAYGRAYVAPAAGACQSLGSGPLAAGAPSADRTPLGILGLGGGVTEWMRDAARPLDAACWQTAPNDGATCDDDAPPRSIRGGAWASPPAATRSTLRRAADPTAPRAALGFRCVVHAP